MGNQLSTQDVARQALSRAQGIQTQSGGPPCRGAIVDYCEGRIDAGRLLRKCTPLEANEFAMLAPALYMRWGLDHGPYMRCRPGRCQYPMDGIHLRECEFDNPLPPEVALPDKYFVSACLQSGDPALMDWARRTVDESYGRYTNASHGHSAHNSHRHTHTRHGHSSRNNHRDYGGHGGNQGHSGNQGRSGRQGHSRHPSHPAPRRSRDHQSHQVRPGRSARHHDPRNRVHWD